MLDTGDVVVAQVEVSQLGEQAFSERLRVEYVVAVEVQFFQLRPLAPRYAAYICNLIASCVYPVLLDRQPNLSYLSSGIAELLSGSMQLILFPSVGVH